MKKSRVETAETRRRIVDVAARQFRHKGIQATGLSDVMSEAGLTNGGFYRHFASKDQLIAEACEASLTEVVDLFEQTASRHEGKDAFKSIVENYLSASHRDNVDTGCPLAGMGSELTRADDTTREKAAQGFNDMVDVIAKRVGRRNADVARADAMFALAAMIGAMTLSRIIVDPDASTLVLQTVRQHLEAL